MLPLTFVVFPSRTIGQSIHTTSEKNNGKSINRNTESRQRQKIFFVKTQCGKNHGEERKFTIICEDYKDSLCQAKCWSSCIGSILLFSRRKRGAVNAPSVLHAWRWMIGTWLHKNFSRENSMREKHEEKEDYKDSLCQAKCWASWIGSNILFSCWKRVTIYAPSVLHAWRQMIPTWFSQPRDLHVLVCCNSRDDGRLIARIACSEIRLGP